MGFAAICDLHWEVKVNSLLFWETVIQRVFASQGFTDLSSINSSFLKSEKVETLTNEEIKLRLDQVLKELSRIGCLYVLLSTLSDDCDFQVIEKSAQILSRFLEVLKHFDFFKPVEYSPSCRLPIKRKHNESESPQTTKSFDRIVNNAAPSVDAEVASASYCIAHSNAVIDEIVNEMDINLLVSVHEKREIISPSQDKVVLKEIKAESFLIQMQSFSAERFLENKKKWLVHKGSDLKSLLDDIITLNAASDTNIMDCY